jgi:16S rRNA (cytosine967-C5)-methyltransferase
VRSVIQGNSAVISPARQVAFSALERVGRGEYASDVLREESRRLESRDAGLAAQIVFGTLRWQGQLDYLIYHYSRRRVTDLEPALALALRTALFQLRYLERIPAHAAVHETVEWVKQVRRKAAGFANAVLRKVRRDPVRWPDRATELSCPEWLLARWTAHFGRQRAEAAARAALVEPAAYIRVSPGTEPPAGLAVQLTGVPGCYAVTGPVPATVRLHDIGSQTVIPQLGLEEGQSYLDLCAAPGNKTVQALETPLGFAVACDVSTARLRSVPPVCPRVVLDGTQALPFGRKFDRIFIDAPCSGTGTIRRNPEIKWRLRETELSAFAERQRALVNSALTVLAPGGLLLYATCSFEREENEEVVRAILGRHNEMQLVSEEWRVPEPLPTPDTMPGPNSGDGFYGAVLQRS